MSDARMAVQKLLGFADHLGARREDGGLREKVISLSKSWHGYEPWLKHELFLWLMDDQGGIDKIKQSADLDEVIGVEKRVALDPRLLRGDSKKQKLVDVAFRLGPGSPQHLVELKTVFIGTGTAPKMTNSAADDLWYLLRVKNTGDTGFGSVSIFVLVIDKEGKLTDERFDDVCGTIDKKAFFHAEELLKKALILRDLKMPKPIEGFVRPAIWSVSGKDLRNASRR